MHLLHISKWIACGNLRFIQDDSRVQDNSFIKNNNYFQDYSYFHENNYLQGHNYFKQVAWPLCIVIILIVMLLLPVAGHAQTKLKTSPCDATETNDIHSEVTYLLKAKAAYYSGKIPIMSDAEYDERIHKVKLAASCMLSSQGFKDQGAKGSNNAKNMHHIRELREDFSKLVAVGHKAQPFNQVIQTNELIQANQIAKRGNQTAMLSLNSTDSLEQAHQWIENTGKKLATSVFLLQPKIDGMAVEITYKKGQLNFVRSRGDGRTGKDILDNVRNAKLVPEILTSPETPLPETLIERDIETHILRGELFANLYCYQEFSTRYATARHFAVATILSKSLSMAQAKCLKVKVYEWVNCPLNTDIECLHSLEQSGVDTFEKETVQLNPNPSPNPSPNSNFTESSSTHIKAMLSNTLAKYSKDKNKAYLADGIVIKAANISDRENIGKSQTAPRWALALKYQAKNKPTKVESISFRVGRTGKITPLLHITPVKISGITVKKVSGHSPAWLVKNDIEINSEILVGLVGDANPQFIKLSKPAKPSKPLKPSKANKASDSKDWRDNLPNVNKGLCIAAVNGCAERFAKQVVYFVKKLAPSIKGVTEKRVNKLIHIGHLTSLHQIFLITEQQWADAGMPANHIKDFSRHFRSSSQYSFKDKVRALGIRGINKTSIEKLTQHVGSFNHLARITQNQLQSFGLSVKQVNSLERLLLQSAFKAQISYLD